jgi:hypothetical protein
MPSIKSSSRLSIKQAAKRASISMLIDARTADNEDPSASKGDESEMSLD